MNTGKISRNGEVHEALRALWDLMEYYIWYPTHETAKGIRENNLQTHRITGAIAIRYLTKEVRSAIKARLEYWQSRKISGPYEWIEDGKNNYIKWTYKGVPIELKILKRRYGFFNHADPVTYNY